MTLCPLSYSTNRENNWAPSRHSVLRLSRKLYERNNEHANMVNFINWLFCVRSDESVTTLRHHQIVVNALEFDSPVHASDTCSFELNVWKVESESRCHISVNEEIKSVLLCAMFQDGMSRTVMKRLKRSLEQLLVISHMSREKISWSWAIKLQWMKSNASNFKAYPRLFGVFKYIIIPDIFIHKIAIPVLSHLALVFGGCHPWFGLILLLYLTE